MLAHFANALVLEYLDQDFYNEINPLIYKSESKLNGIMNYIRKQRTGEIEIS